METKKSMRRKSIVLVMVIVLILGSTSTVFAGYKDISVSAPSEIVVYPDKAATISISFKGEGIAYAKIATSTGITGTISTVWKGYPSVCTSTVKIKGTQSGKVVFLLGNNVDGAFKKVTIPVKLGNVMVSHPKGVNLRSGAGTNSKILKSIPYKTVLAISQVKGDWAKTKYNGVTGWVNTKYVTASQAQQNTLNNSDYSAAKAIQYAKDNVWKTSEKCAGFLSNCLRAGGLPIDYTASCNTLAANLETSQKGSFQSLVINDDGTISFDKNKGKISYGDPILIFCTKCLSYDGLPYVHAVLVANSSGKVKVYATNSRHAGDVYSGFKYCFIHGSHSSVKAYAYHMMD